MKVVLGFLCSGKARGFTPPARTKGLRFEATDMQFSAGEGDLVRGPGEAIMMAVAGRKDALDELSGPGSTALSLRLSFN